MIAADLSKAVRAELDNYTPPLTDGELSGAPWRLERIRDEIGLLRAALVLPTQRVLHIHQHADERVWLVAVESEVAVYFDEVRREYGLGSLGDDGSITDWGVYGDLVGTFMAR